MLLPQQEITELQVAHPRTSNWADFRRGFTDTFPIWAGIMPFGIVCALTAHTSGLNPLQIQVLFLTVYAGTAQLTAVNMIAGGADILSIIFTTFIINMRLLLYSMSFAIALPKLNWWCRLLLPHCLLDQTYALTIKRISNKEAGAGLLLGAGVGLLVCWNLSALIGMMLGNAIPNPNAFGIQLTFPLLLMVTILPYLKSRPTWGAVLAASVIALGLRLVLPGKWYLLLAAIGGCIVGGLLEGRKG